MCAVALVSIMVGACGDAAPVPSTAAAVDSGTDVALTSSVAPRGTPRIRVVPPKGVNWIMSFGGAEPLYPRMSLADAVITMDGDLWQTNTSVTCSDFRSTRAPGMRFVFLRWRLARIEVVSGSIASVEGIRIGSTEKQVFDAYPGRVTVSDDVFTGGHFLSVAPPEGSDTTVRIVFDTDGQRVTRFRTGLRYAVEWAEGCS